MWAISEMVNCINKCSAAVSTAVRVTAAPWYFKLWLERCCAITCVSFTAGKVFLYPSFTMDFPLIVIISCSISPLVLD